MSTKTASPKATRRQFVLIEEHLELEARIEDLNEQLAEVKARLVKSIGLGNTVEVSDVAQFTVTTQTSYAVDFDALIVLRPYWARKVTKKVFDRAKFSLLRKANEVPEDVLDIVEEEVSAPFLRITLRRPKSVA